MCAAGRCGWHAVAYRKSSKFTCAFSRKQVERSGAAVGCAAETEAQCDGAVRCWPAVECVSCLLASRCMLHVSKHLHAATRASELEAACDVHSTRRDVELEASVSAVVVVCGFCAAAG